MDLPEEASITRPLGVGRWPPCAHLCLARAGGLGRVGLSLRALPVILPVGFRIDGDAVLVWGPGLAGVPSAQLSGNVVAFQTDGADLDTGQTWSLNVQGMATSAGAVPVPHLRIPLEIVTCRHFDGLPPAGPGA